MRQIVIKLTDGQKMELNGHCDYARHIREQVKSAHELIESRILDFVTPVSPIARGDIKHQSLSECGEYIIVSVYGAREMHRTKKGSDR